MWVSVGTLGHVEETGIEGSSGDDVYRQVPQLTLLDQERYDGAPAGRLRYLPACRCPGYAMRVAPVVW